ncbi:alpha/beta hydrolase [Leucobacter insecticola]|uniref:Alpha/beta hydrolase n=1 Tax=Leucobacter insecticola TaxID=2714934 RepID=A0A6G8FGT9_9MICO|nr:alpha/beta fold hydrolase [Leucobacter insecticola]QIM15680.1 alpha/beta hydrolase [Leucobacter insecticola]
MTTKPRGSNIEPTEFSYIDAHGVEIQCYRWDAEEPVGLVQISHGIGEHSRRYDDFARALVGTGFTVYADDHRGHGETGRAQWEGDLSRLGRLGPGGLRATEEAILQLTSLMRNRHPGLPLIMYSHSWGSLMAQRILNEHPRAWDALILSGTALRTFKHMESGDLNARWKHERAHGFEWLSRDPATARAFIEDPLCFAADILKLFGVADGLRLFGKPVSGLAPEVPILLISGADDPLSRNDGVRELAELYRKRGVRDVTVKLYPEARHETLNETNRDEVQADLITWMLERVGG